MDKKYLLDVLGAVHQELLEKENFVYSIQKLEEIKIHRLIGYILYGIQDYDIDDKLIIQLLIRILQNIYNNSTELSPVTDEDYDKLYELNRELNDEEIVGSSFNTTGKIISNHNYTDLRGTLDKIHFIKSKDKKSDKRKSIEDWLKSIENKIRRKLTKNELIAHIFPKWDGVSGIFECNHMGEVIKALSRGDTNTNEAIDWTKLFKGIFFNYVYENNNGHEFGVKTEVVMTLNNFNKFCGKEGNFKNPRSAVTSIVKPVDADRKFLQYLTIIPLQVQDFITKEIFIAPQSYTDYPYDIISLDNLDTLYSLFELLEKRAEKEIGVNIDGIVIRLADKNIQKKLGREYNINKYEIAYKFPPEQKKTILLDINFSVGLLGAITPVAIIKPVKIKGNTVTNISLGSIDRFESLGLRSGDEVIVKYDVIPYLTKTDACKRGVGHIFITPTNCPYCKQPLVEEPILKCVNEKCDYRIIGKIVNFITKMNIPEIDIGKVKSLFDAGILTSIEAIYCLKNHKRQITSLNGFGEKSFNKIISGIDSRRDVYDYELLGSIGITDIGNKIFKKILNIYYIDELIDICYKRKDKKLISIGGIKNKTADKIIKGINSNAKLIKFLRSELNIRRDKRKYVIKVCFTKIRDKDFENFLDSKNVLVLENYNKDVDILIIPFKGIDSTKVNKAEKDKKEIITIDEAYKMFGYK